MILTVLLVYAHDAVLPTGENCGKSPHFHEMLWNSTHFHQKVVIWEKSSQGPTRPEGMLMKHNTFSAFREVHPDA